MNESFDFALEVFRLFDFLLTGHAFRLAALEPHVVRFESETRFVDVSFCQPAGPLTCHVGLRAPSGERQEEAFTIDDIQDLMALREAGAYMPFEANSEAHAVMLLPRLAGCVKAYAIPVLEGGPEILDRLRLVRSRNAELLERELRLQPIRDRAETAWRAKDYGRVAELFETVRDDLTPAERKKLEYCQKRRP